MSTTIVTVLSVAAGGALGAVARYGVNILAVALAGHAFPWGTMSVNILGSFLMGALIAGLAHVSVPVPDAMRVFVVTGFLGAFTTFSTFSLDSVTLWERGEVMQAVLYGGGSVVLSIAALVLGLFIVRSLV